jgi:hypothetical protein
MNHGSTLTGSWTVDDAALACNKDHWRQYLSEDEKRWQFDLEAAMETAEICRDFEERSIDSGAHMRKWTQRDFV